MAREASGDEMCCTEMQKSLYHSFGIRDEWIWPVTPYGWVAAAVNTGGRNYET